MSRVALVVSVVSLGVAGWALHEGRSAREDQAAEREGRGELEARFHAQARELAALRARAATEAEPLAPRAPQLGGSGGGTVTSTPGLPPGAARAWAEAGAPRQTGTEERLARLEAEVAKTRSAVDESERQRREEPRISFGMPEGFWDTVDAAAKAMDLDAAQRAGLERVVEETRSAIDELHARPNDQGETLKALEESLQTVAAEEDPMAHIGEHIARTARFRKTKVPGTDETYGQAEERLRRDGRTRARSWLRPDQAKIWDRSHPDALFGGESGVFATEVVQFGSPVTAPPPR